MAFIDYAIFIAYMLGVLGIGFYFFKKNEDVEDYYVGKRNVPASHVGISVVATDVGGGFSIGLGGLGYIMGLSGTWLLFTGLVGAWASAVLIIPKIKRLDEAHGMMTYPDFLRHAFNPKVAGVAAVISAIGYMGFTGGQVLAGAKLFAATILDELPFGMDPTQASLFFIGFIIIAYTSLGGLKAVIYTDTVQWIILLFGLIFFAAPFAISKIGGLSDLKQRLPEGYFSLNNLTAAQFINWMVIIIPIWFIAMTLYQRIYATKDVKEARKAWFIAGLFEYPIMAFTGVFLGMCSRVLYPGVEQEMGLPLLIKGVLPIGVTGIVVAAYFSAIMSTADSCLMASSGNVLNDLIARLTRKKLSDKRLMTLSQVLTLAIGLVAIFLASYFANVLEIILLAYSFMVAGLFVPTLGAYFGKKKSSFAAFWSMILGGSSCLVLIIGEWKLPFGLDPAFYGIIVSLVVYLLFTALDKQQAAKTA